ncbi:MAG TPA: prepilin-type N-terminal cleavage/methylation domain-containing protein [Sedimentisphaerales bacterium]|nr:prepilin-type N-terminal cleavage/methylation domain-containing protein [Sedimentisphaerales bacterium]
MRKLHNFNSGFSLTECLLAIGILAVGMLFIAGVFPVGIHFTTIATERTIAAVVADEAFAKIRLYALGVPNNPLVGINFSKLDPNQLTDYAQTVSINPIEFAYPSDPNMDISQKQYYWSALCRLTEPYSGPFDPRRLVQVTVFVCRKVGSGTTYQGWATNWPVPVPVGVSVGPGPDTLQIEPGKEAYINDGYTIVDDENGRIYRVLERYAPPNHNTVRLDRPWNPGMISPDRVWVVPPPVSGGRYPCIAVYQRVIRF